MFLQDTQGVVCVHPGLLGYPSTINHNSTTNHRGITTAPGTTTTTTPGVVSSVAVVQSFPSHECYLHRESSDDGGGDGSSSVGGGDDNGSTPVCLVIRPKSSLTNTSASTSTGSSASASGASPFGLADQPGVLVLRPAQRIRVSITARYDTPRTPFRSFIRPTTTFLTSYTHFQQLYPLSIVTPTFNTQHYLSQHSTLPLSTLTPCPSRIPPLTLNTPSTLSFPLHNNTASHPKHSFNISFYSFYHCQGYSRGRSRCRRGSFYHCQGYSRGRSRCRRGY